MAQDIPENKGHNEAQTQEVETVSPSSSSRHDEIHAEKGLDHEDDGYIHHEVSDLCDSTSQH